MHDFALGGELTSNVLAAAPCNFSSDGKERPQLPIEVANILRREIRGKNLDKLRSGLSDRICFSFTSSRKL